MEIKDLVPKQGNVDIVAVVQELEPVREFEKFGKTGKVCNAIIKDDSGTVKLTLWNEQTEMINAGDKVQITNGYVNEWQGEKQLTTGKFGKLEILEKGEAPAKEAAPSEEVTEDEVLEEDVVDDESLEKEE
jgi:replication factor A1